MPIFEQLRAQGDLPCTYPLHMASHGTAFIRGGSRSTPLSPHAPHCHPSTHWVSFAWGFIFMYRRCFRYFSYLIEMVRKKECAKEMFFLLIYGSTHLSLAVHYIWFWYMSLWVEKNIDNNLFPLSLTHLLSGWDLCSNFIITIGNLVHHKRQSERKSGKNMKKNFILNKRSGGI